MNYFTVIGVHQITTTEFIQVITVPFVVISIVSPEFEKFNIPYNSLCKDILSLRFHDIINGSVSSFNKVKELKVINDNDIKQILEFADKHKDITDWVIHCEAGISRSAAVAMALSEIMNNTKNPQTYIQSKYPLMHHNVNIKLKILKSFLKTNSTKKKYE